MKYPHIAACVIGSPLMLARHKLNTLLSVLSPRLDAGEIVLDGELIAQGATQPSHLSNVLVQQSGLGVVQIHGSLTHRSLGLDALSGLMSYTEIENQFMAALENDQVEHIVLDIDSPGGEVSGVFDLVDRIYEARQIKPITALINESGFSAAYALASAAHKIIVPRTAGVGSIGVIAAHVDQSVQDKQNGLAVTTVFAGDRKNDLNPHAPLSDEALGQLQRQVDETYDLFVNTVARNRGLSTAAIKKTQAGVFFGVGAVEKGLADTVLPIHLAITQLQHKGDTMPEINQTQTPLSETIPETSVTPASHEPLAAETIAEPLHRVHEAETEARLSARLSEGILNAERERVVGILGACATMNRPELATEFVKKGLTVEQASHQILNTLAAETEQSQITSTVTPYSNNGDENPLIKNAQQRAGMVVA